MRPALLIVAPLVAVLGISLILAPSIMERDPATVGEVEEQMDRANNSLEDLDGSSYLVRGIVAEVHEWSDGGGFYSILLLEFEGACNEDLPEPCAFIDGYSTGPVRSEEFEQEFRVVVEERDNDCIVYGEPCLQGAQVWLDLIEPRLTDTNPGLFYGMGALLLFVSLLLVVAGRSRPFGTQLEHDSTQ